MKIEYENAVVTIHFSQRPEEEVMENLKSATEKFLKNVKS